MTSDFEAQRIRKEYARRAREVPARFYGWEQSANLFAHQQVVSESIRMLNGCGFFPLTGRRILDVGCGSGIWLLEFLQWGADPEKIAGIDLIPDRIDAARQRIAGADLQIGQAASLPWPDQRFDVVTQFVAFTSILAEDVKRSCAAEMLRVLKPGGIVLWYDFRLNNPWNANVRGIKATEIRALFAPYPLVLKKVTLAPPIARRVAMFSPVMALLGQQIPVLCSHYLGVIRKPEGRA